jgi:4-hydroxybenzoate polyprenyltransferase
LGQLTLRIIVVSYPDIGAAGSRSKVNLSGPYLVFALRVLRLPIIGPLVFPLHSLLFKILRGEGVLLFVNLSLLLSLKSDNFFYIGKTMALSVLVLAQLYGFNDAHDAANDVKDPDKPAGVADVILKKHFLFLAATIAWAVALTAVAYFLMPDSFYGVLAMFILNSLYSTVFKGLPVMDVLVVSAWGGCFPLLLGFGIPYDLLIVIGGMTGVSHVWQTLRDKDADMKLGITTVAVFSKSGSIVVVFVLCALIAYTVMPRFEGYIRIFFGGLCLIPLLLFFYLRKIRIVWLASKVIFGVVWLALLRNAMSI